LQIVCPLVFSFSVLGSVIVIFAAVVLLSALFFTTSLSFVGFGFDDVPALLGEREAVAVTDGGGVWA
jgi:hypothetical protein